MATNYVFEMKDTTSKARQYASSLNEKPWQKPLYQTKEQTSESAVVSPDLTESTTSATLLSSHLENSDEPKIRTPPGRLPSFGSEEQPSTGSFRSLEKSIPKNGKTVYSETAEPSHATTSITGHSRNFTEGTVPASDSDSDSTNPYHSDEETERNQDEEEPAANEVVSRTQEVIQEPDSNIVPTHKTARGDAATHTNTPRREEQRRQVDLEKADNNTTPVREVDQPEEIKTRRQSFQKAKSANVGPDSILVADQREWLNSPGKQQSRNISKTYSQKKAPSSARALATPNEKSTPNVKSSPIRRLSMGRSASSRSSSRPNPPTGVPPRKPDKTKQQQQQPKQKKGFFGRAATPLKRATSAPRQRANSSQASAGSSTNPSSSQEPRRSWMGKFRKKSSSRSGSMVVITPEAPPPISSVPSQSDAGELSMPTTQHSFTAAHISTTKIVQALVDDSDAEMSPETAEDALRELEALQLEVTQLRASAVRGSGDEIRLLQTELDAARKAVSQLEGLNKNYRKAQKQMLKDLQDSQAELEKFRQERAHSKYSGDSQKLAEELASTMAELLALQGQHHALLKSQAESNQETENSMQYAIDSAADEARLNLQKDLAQAMATISKLQEENDSLRQRLSRLESVEQRLKQAEQERDEYLSQLNDQEARYLRGLAPNASAVVNRLQKEKKQYQTRETALKDKIAKLEMKNENQKNIFQTAVEIKEVEMKITQKERDILATRLEEYKQHRSMQDDSKRKELDELQSRLRSAEEESREYTIHIDTLSDQIEDLKKEVASKNVQVEALEQLLNETQAQAESRVEEATVDLNNEIISLKQQIGERERSISDLQERSQLESFKARRVMDEKVTKLQKQVEEFEQSINSRDETIRKLEDDLKIRSNELLEEKRRSNRRFTPPRREGDDAVGSPRSAGEDKNAGHSDRLAALRSRLGNYESVMREKVAAIRQMDQDASSTSSQSSQPEPLTAAPPMQNDKIAEMEQSLRARDTRIKELEGELANAKAVLEKAKERELEREDSDDSSQEIQELIESLKASDDRVTLLHQQLEEARERLAEVESQTEHTSSSLPLASSHAPSSVGTSGESARGQSLEVEQLTERLSQKEKVLLELQDKIESLLEEKGKAAARQRELESQLREVQSKNESNEAQLASAQNVNGNFSPEDGKRIKSLEDELAITSKKLELADAKIEMLEEFIHEDQHSQLNISIGSTLEGGLEDVGELKTALIERENEASELKKAAETAKLQLIRARSSVEGLEQERAHTQAKLAQLQSLVEKQSRDETDMQLYKKCIEVAEISAEKEDLTQKLRMANAVIQRLEQEFEGNDNGNNEDKSLASATANASIKLTETELVVDDLRGKLVAAEKANRELRENNEKLNKTIKGDAPSADEGMKERLNFLEQQNAAYAASLKALRIEIATRHEGTAFE